MKRKRIIQMVLLGAFALLFADGKAEAQNVALKTNALYWATLTPNIGVEAGLGARHTAQIFYGLNPWKNSSSGKSLRHRVLQPEYRYRFCEAFNGWFVGAHLMGGEFNAANITLPLGYKKGLRDHRMVRRRRSDGRLSVGDVTPLELRGVRRTRLRLH